MRTVTLLLVLLIITLLGNIIAYSVSEDYRFFVKKIKYSDDLVYELDNVVDDTQRVVLLEDSSGDDVVVVDDDITNISEGFTFLDALWIQQAEDITVEELPELLEVEQEILNLIKEKFVLSQSDQTISLFDITTEYPDPYHEYANKHLSFYIFPTKTYGEVYNIFEVLRYELPYSLNKTNNFGSSSFYINLEWAYDDQKVRIVFEHESRAFWLKIKKDSYNTVKQILDELKTR